MRAGGHAFRFCGGGRGGRAAVLGLGLGGGPALLGQLLRRSATAPRGRCSMRADRRRGGGRRTAARGRRARTSARAAATSRPASTWRTPTTMPSAPMKRVSRPARMPLSETSTMPTASASAAGVSSTRRAARARSPPMSCTAPIVPAPSTTSLASITRPTPSATHETAEQHAADDRQVEGPARELRRGGRGSPAARNVTRVGERDEPEALTEAGGDQLGRVVGDVASAYGDLQRRLVEIVPGAASLRSASSSGSDGAPALDRRLDRPGRRRSRRPRRRRRARRAGGGAPPIRAAAAGSRAGPRRTRC